jgi:hypothetical protein
VSRDFHLITRLRPDAWAFARTVSEAAGRKVDIEGDFGDPDDYLHISADDGLWIEVEPPGHIEADDLREMYAVDVALPDPDDEGCLWFTAASVPASAPGASAQVIRETFSRLAENHEGIEIEPG